MPPFPPSHLCLALLHGHRKSRVVLILQYYREPFNENSSFHCALMSTPHSFSCIHSFILSFLNHQLCDNWAGVQGKEAYLGCLSLFQSYTPLFCPMKILLLAFIFQFIETSLNKLLFSVLYFTFAIHCGNLHIWKVMMNLIIH